MEKKLDGNHTRMLQASNIEEVLEAADHKAAASHPSRKLFELDEPLMRGTGEVRTNS